MKKKLTIELDEDVIDEMVVQSLKEDFELLFKDIFEEEDSDELKNAYRVVLRHVMYYKAADAYIESIENKYK